MKTSVFQVGDYCRQTNVKNEDYHEDMDHSLVGYVRGVTLLPMHRTTTAQAARPSVLIGRSWSLLEA